MRSQDEIVAFYQGYKGRDIFGFTLEALADFMDAGHVKRFLKPDADLSAWTSREPSREAVLEEMRSYMVFAWEKVGGHRGISASRSVQKMKAWLWLLGDDDLVAYAEDDGNFAQYGAPILARISGKYEFPIPTSPRVKRMTQGQPCRVDCDEGCGRGLF